MREKQREETRRRLYLAALEVFRQDGLAGCRIDDIAQKAEVSRAAFYFHFPTKEHVLIDFLAESEAPALKRLDALPDGATFEQLLTTCAEGLAEFWQKEPKLLVDALTTYIKVTAVLEDRDSGAVRGFMAKRFRELAGRGELVTTVPPEVLSDFFISYMLVALISWAGTPNLPLDATLKASMQLFLQGARPSTPMAGGPKKK
ncbi:MAG: TetR/AcrR family transcriptional regulator [Myxococcaceae bacterium]|nr:TetR/AcrR family transcriptional regulator [Myxococcaceae bacterium]